MPGELASVEHSQFEAVRRPSNSSLLLPIARMSLLKVVVVLATANAFLAPVTQRPATIMQAATIAAKDVSALRKASGASQCTHEEVPSQLVRAVSHRWRLVA